MQTVCVCVCGLSVCVHPCRAATVLSTLCRGQLVAMTSLVCRPSRPTTSFCPSWVRKTVDTCWNYLQSLPRAVKAATMSSWVTLLSRREGLQQPQPGEHGAPRPFQPAGGSQADQPGRVHRGGAAAADGETLPKKAIYLFALVLPNWLILMFDHVSNPRMRFCCPGCSVTPTCWPHAWFSAPAASCGSWLRSWLTVSCCNPTIINPLGISIHCLLLCTSVQMEKASIFSPLPLPAGSADTLLRTYFPDGMSESLIAYLLHGVLKALEYLHRMGYVHRLVHANTNI